MSPVLELTGITKRFGTLLANDGIDLTLGRGEVLALLGENGAGKTTLMSILFGHYVADAGTVRAFGQVLPPGDPKAAIAAGIGMVHQHFTLASNLSVLDNVTIGTEPLSAWRSRRGAARRRLVELAERFGLPVDPDRRVGELSVGERQRVEILKSLYRDARILILDEPTAVLTPQESERLFSTLRGMARQGLSLIFISHKLHEVVAHADRVAVLRGGRLVAERPAAGASRAELAELMVGRRVVHASRVPLEPGGSLLRLDGVRVEAGGRRLLDDIALDLREREVLGIVGVAGNGQDALSRLFAGTAPQPTGRIELLGRPVARLDHDALAEAGLAHIPEDRHHEGVVGDLRLYENAVLERIRDRRFSRLGLLRRQAALDHAAGLIRMFDIRGAEPTTRTRLLSGGNMQKLILGRNLVEQPRLIVASQPTRGLDEGAVAEIHRRLLEARGNGAGVLLISEDLDEIFRLADRVQVIFKGRLSAPLPIEAASEARLGLMMAGEDGDAPRAA
ncbi:ABC transporter ATP-binding protein [Geminicoccus harenae]|uniref:ABC transporter ATP-binding protein n=3 Tax=Geminicoccus harenae TaxID=2498453 RepID=UPI001C9625A1|nr:ABC transporter ATP-binding protein [Geminicoccus harenae]